MGGNQTKKMQEDVHSLAGNGPFTGGKPARRGACADHGRDFGSRQNTGWESNGRFCSNRHTVCILKAHTFLKGKRPGKTRTTFLLAIKGVPRTLGGGEGRRERLGGD